MLLSSNTKEKFKIFEATITKEIRLPIEVFRSDPGGEYNSKAFRLFLQSKGIKRQNTDPGRPKQNSFAERRGRILVMMDSSMLHHAILPAAPFWTIFLACCIPNRVFTKALGTCL